MIEKIRVATACALLLLTLDCVFAAEKPVPSKTVQEEGIFCAPHKVRSTDTLNIDLPVSHGSDFAIVSPAGEYFFLSFRQPDTTSSLQPSLPPNVFANITHLSLVVGNTKGISWNKKTTTPVKIFNKSGLYKILVAPVLETEDPVLDGWCKITFRK